MIRENDKNGRVFDVSVELKDNAMLKIRPDLFDEWDFVKNDELGLVIYKVTKGSHKIAFWICLKCESSYDMSIAKKSMGRGCPYCSGYRVNHTNSLAINNPNLAVQWHPTKNGTKTPFDATCNSNKTAHWICKIGHEWEAVISSRHRGGHGCPYCAQNPKLLVGFNDMWTTNPELASQLADAEDGYRYTQGNDAKVDWKCPDCETIIKSRSVHSIKSQGLSCTVCSDGVSYPEKIIGNLLNELNICYVYDNTTEWSQRRRYDYYLPVLNMIIEVHGKQHYEDSGFHIISIRDAKDEKSNDEFKRELALKNGVPNYIEIDARLSNFDFIKESVLKSDMKNFFCFKNVDWEKINKESQKSRNIEIFELWKKGFTKKEISEIVKISLSSTYRILNSFSRSNEQIADSP